MKKKKIVITGSQGYLGRHVVQVARRLGHYVLEMDVPGGDVRDLDRTLSAWKGHRIDSVIHLAALVSVGDGENQVADYYETNVHGTRNIMEASVCHGIPRVVLASSLAVKGTLGIPESTYAWTKHLAEEIGKAFSTKRDLEVLNLRVANIAGNRHLSTTHLIPNVVQALAGGPPLKIHQSLEHVRDFVHVDDVSRAFVHFATFNPYMVPKMFGWSVNTTFEIGRGRAVTTRDVIEKAEQITGKEVPIEMGEHRPGDPTVLVADPTLALDMGWNPTGDLHKIMKTAISGREA